MAFSFGFSGDDIVPDEHASSPQPPAPIASAFPVQGKPQLPPTHHDLSTLLAQLPSKIAYSLLDVTLDDGTTVQIPRRELWDVRLQLMAEEEEEDGQGAEGLGSHDVKTGVYEGGFKSWESSVDLVKVLAGGKVLAALEEKTMRVIELGCGTALPSVAIFQWAMAMPSSRQPLSLILADYNPSVLQLVTLPNLILAWALSHAALPALADAFSMEGEVELGPSVLSAFTEYLSESGISVSFVSGAWSPAFVDILSNLPRADGPASTLLLGAETIYSPFALKAFTETTFAILERDGEAGAYVAAKRLYFGVGGSLDDFVQGARERGAVVTQLREETEGVRRGVVHCVLGAT
ncbi:hypothetical protein G7046_g4557 [Stylonectria norvegica]|nr:hypothetical protein G7046_g4557 [Stylonectria norvegica]